jgi:periplasmic protein TonB
MFSGLDAVQPQTARRWTATVSFTLQAALVAAGLVWPVIHPESLSESFLQRKIFRPMAVGFDRPQSDRQPVQNNGTESRAPVFPIVVRTGPRVSLVGPGPSGPYIPGAPVIPAAGGPGIENVLPSADAMPVPRPTEPSPTQARPVSRIMSGNLIRKIEPRYPVIARQLGLEGTVVIKALISRDGNIEQAEAISGQPFLVPEALAAVRQWKYKPYFLNGQPVEVETQVIVKFSLNR